MKDTFKLLRFPFSFFLMPLFLFALSQADAINTFTALVSFLIIHLLVYPASNGYNSYIDSDEESIGGLEKPPQPTETLFYITFLMDLAALLLSAWLISSFFSCCIGLYILASRAYSSKKIRLKKYAVAGFLTVTIFQGAFTYFMSTVGITNTFPVLGNVFLFLLLGTSFQIAGAYPLTQIYQHQQDMKDGIITLSYRLGYKGTFIFTAIMFFFCNVFYFVHFHIIDRIEQFYIIQGFFLPIIIYFLYWLRLVLKNKNNANFTNTMRMNFIASLCMNSCFVVLYFINHH